MEITLLTASEGIALFTALTAFGTMIIATTAVITAVRQHKMAVKAMGADVAFRLEEKFYHTALFREIRSGAARELMEVQEGKNKGDVLPNFESLADFFEFIGALHEEGALSSDICWNSFYRRAFAYFKYADDLGLIKKQRGLRPTRWVSYEDMLNDLSTIQDEKSRSIIGQEEIQDLMRRERSLSIPSLPIPHEEVTRQELIL